MELKVLISPLNLLFSAFLQTFTLCHYSHPNPDHTPLIDTRIHRPNPSKTHPKVKWACCHSQNTNPTPHMLKVDYFFFHFLICHHHHSHQQGQPLNHYSLAATFHFYALLVVFKPLILSSINGKALETTTKCIE